MKQVFKLFASCIPVNGASRYVICDLQRSELFIIPEGLYTILVEYENWNIQDIKSVFENEFDDHIDNHFDFLIKNELGFMTSEPEKFPKIEVKWETPSLVSNIIIEVSENSDHSYQLIFDQLNIVGCRFVELRFYNLIDLLLLKEIIKLSENSKIRNISIYLHFNPNIYSGDLDILLLQFQRVGNIVVHSVPSSIDINHDNRNIFYTSDVISNNDCCGQVSSKYFNLNIDHYMESQFHNTCLNKKMTVDISGDFKNCPSLPGNFGNIRNTQMTEVLLNNDFTKLWNIKKDQIEICKDCEFRYICTDCRAFRSDELNLYSKPKKCGYDPYAGIWDHKSSRNLNEYIL